jgi:hypothetical protein
VKNTDIALLMGATLLFFFLQAQTAPDASEWALRRTGDAEKVYLTLEVRKRSGEGRHHWRQSNEIPWSSIRGLDPAGLDGGGPVKFEIARDAGRFRCEGEARGGRASGVFTFAPSPAFAEGLRKLDYDAPSDDQMFSMAIMDITLEFARRASEANLRATTRDLIDMRVHGVDARYIDETRTASIKGLTARDLIDFRIHGVQAPFLRDLAGAGYDYEPREIVELRIHGVEGEFVGELKRAGYDAIAAREVRELRIHGVSSDYVRDLRRHGVAPAPRDLVQMKIHGVTPEFLRDLHDAGYADIPVSEVTQLRQHGVAGRFIREARELGYRFSPRDLIQLRNHGVDAAYLRRLKDAGFENLGADKIVKLRVHGVD